jgi:predicted transcriptional regulator
VGEETEALRPRRNAYHRGHMFKSKEVGLENPEPALEDEDEKTLVAFDEGIRNAEAGRTTPVEEVGKRLHELAPPKFWSCPNLVSWRLYRYSVYIDRK